MLKKKEAAKRMTTSISEAENANGREREKEKNGRCGFLLIKLQFFASLQMKLN